MAPSGGPALSGGQVGPGGVVLRVVPLAEREVEIAGQVAAGRTNADIAAELYISPGTVKTHVAGIRRKLGVSNRVGVAMHAWEMGYPRPDARAGRVRVGRARADHARVGRARAGRVRADRVQVDHVQVGLRGRPRRLIGRRASRAGAGDVGARVQ